MPRDTPADRPGRASPAPAHRSLGGHRGPPRAEHVDARSAVPGPPRLTWRSTVAAYGGPAAQPGMALPAGPLGPEDGYPEPSPSRPATAPHEPRHPHRPQGAASRSARSSGRESSRCPRWRRAWPDPASLVAWAALVLLSVPLAATFAALGSRLPDTGGVSTYVRRAFGNRAAGAVGWCFYFAVPVGAPPASMMAGGYVADVVGGGRATTIAVAAALILGAGAMNAAGLRLSGRVQLALAGAWPCSWSSPSRWRSPTATRTPWFRSRRTDGARSAPRRPCSSGGSPGGRRSPPCPASTATPDETCPARRRSR